MLQDILMLSQRDRDILAFEDAHPRLGGVKADQIERRFQMRPAVYYQRLNRIIDDPAALEAEPMLVRRLQRLRRRRMAARVGRVS